MNRGLDHTLEISRGDPNPRGRWAGKDLSEIARFGDRLGVELSNLVACIPAQHLSATALGRWLGVSRATCQRVLLAVRSIGDGSQVLRNVPGVAGLHEFVGALAARVDRRPEIERAEAVVQDYARLVQRIGGSHARLARLAAQHLENEKDVDVGTSPRRDEILSARQSIYKGSCVTTGTWSAANLVVQALRPSPSCPGRLDEAHARGYIGVQRRASGVALYSRLMGPSDPKAMETLEGEHGEGRQWSALLAEFCSTPLPTVVSQIEGESNNWIILGDKAVQQPVDIVLGGRSIGSLQDPRAVGNTHLSAMTGVRFPARTLVYDLYLHRELAAGGRVHASALVRHSGDADPVKCWHDKLVYEPDLRAMGPGIIRTDPTAFPRMRELASHVFARAGWDPHEFEAWRAEVVYPTPGMIYSITLHPAMQEPAREQSTSPTDGA